MNHPNHVTQIGLVTAWIDVAKQARGNRNTANYFGYMLEECAEGLEALSNGHPALIEVARVMKAVSMDFRIGAFDSHVEMLTNEQRVELLDSACDTAWVSVGLGHMLGDVSSAFDEVIRSNWSKFDSGVALLDPTGKVIKSKSFTKPALAQFLRPQGD